MKQPDHAKLRQERVITITIRPSNGFQNSPLSWFSQCLRLEDLVSAKVVEVTDSHTPDELKKRSQLCGLTHGRYLDKDFTP